MSGQFLKGAVARGMREAGAILRHEGGIEVRCSFDICTPFVRRAGEVLLHFLMVFSLEWI
jgi:hypothetical protein